jgi:hypothetical protein
MTHLRLADRGKGEGADIKDLHGSRIMIEAKRFKTPEVRASVVIVFHKSHHFSLGVGFHTNVIRIVSQLCCNAPRQENRRLEGNRCPPQSDLRRTLGYRLGATKRKYCWLTLHISTLLCARSIIRFHSQHVVN